MRRAASYLVAVLATAAAVYGRVVLHPLLQEHLPFVTLFAAVALAVWIGGFGPALVAAVAGYVAIERLVLSADPAGALLPETFAGQVGLAAYAFTCLVITLLGCATRRARRKVQAAAEEVRERTWRLEAAMAERRLAEQALQRTEADLERLADRTPVGLLRCSRDRRFVFVNRAAAEILGRPADKIVGRPLVEVMGPEAYAAVEPQIARVLAGDEIEFEVEIPDRREGAAAADATGRRFLHVAYTPDRDERGAVAGWFASVQDISDRRAADAALEERERLFRTLVAASSHSTWQYRPGGPPIKQISEEATAWWRAFTGQTEAERTARDGAGWLDAVHPQDRDAAWKNWMEIRAAKGPTAALWRVRRARDGAWRWLSIRGVPVVGKDGVIAEIAGTLNDVTEQKEAEQAKSASEGRFRLLADAAPVFIWLAGTDKLCTWFNRPWLEFTGRSLEQEIGNGWAENVHAEDLDRCLHSYVEAFDARRPFSMEYRLRRHDGEWRWVLHHGAPLHDPDGAFAGYVGSCVDITDRRASEDALRDGDRRKDEFLATLAHELRNPLAPVRNAVEVLRLKGSPTPEVQWAREIIDRQMRQMARIIDDLLDVSRITRDVLELRRERVDLATVLQAAVETSEGLIETSGHELDVRLPQHPIFLQGDVTRLAQVFSNLLSNAAKFSEPGSRITLQAEKDDSDRAADGRVGGVVATVRDTHRATDGRVGEVGGRVGATDGGVGEVVVTVRDTGIGIPKEMQPRIFDIFVQVDRSLERSQGGLGIGLTLVKRLVEMHGGSIEVKSEGRGRGSEFVVRLPIAPLSDAAETPAPRPRVERTTPARGRVLVADDNRDAAASLSTMLDILGYETRTATDGAEAVEAAEEFRPEVALLDIGMPRSNGYDVARHIRNQAWGKEVILMAVTGWGQQEDRRRTLEAGFDHHLVKPVDPDLLASLLQRRRENG